MAEDEGTGATATAMTTEERLFDYYMYTLRRWYPYTSGETLADQAKYLVKNELRQMSPEKDRERILEQMMGQ